MHPFRPSRRENLDTMRFAFASAASLLVLVGFYLLLHRR